MKEIQHFVGESLPSAVAYGAFAQFYAQISTGTDLHEILRDFCETANM